jgi:Transposase IS116/IS110/IS902 family
VSRVARPAAAHSLGEVRLTRWLEARSVYGAKKLAGRIVAAAKVQRYELPAAEARARLLAEIASEILRTKQRMATLDTRLAELVEADPQGKILMSLPGMGTIMTAEFLAEVDDLGHFGSPDSFAAAAGIAPVLRSSGSVSYRRGPRGATWFSRGSFTNPRIAQSCATSGAGPSTDASGPRGRRTSRLPSHHDLPRSYHYHTGTREHPSVEPIV